MMKMKKNDKIYWEKRQEQKYLAGEMQINEYYKGLEKSFEQSKEEIQGVINNFYARYARENGLATYADAQKLLDKAEIGGLRNFINKANKHMGEYDLELNNMSIKARITRYQAMEQQIDAILQQLYAIEYEKTGAELLGELYKDQYYKTWFNIDVYKGFHAEFGQIDPRTIEELIKYPFNGANFSDRIWKQKDNMLVQLNESITTILIQGRDPSTLSKAVAKKFGTKEFEAYRLLHTEGSFMIEQGTLAAYLEEKLEKYQILATLDSKTSRVCRYQDNKIYKVTEYNTGINAPPFHPFCRSTTVPYYDDVDYSRDERGARDGEGKSIKVPANMKYTEWQKLYGVKEPQ